MQIVSCKFLKMICTMDIPELRGCVLQGLLSGHSCKGQTVSRWMASQCSGLNTLKGQGAAMAQKAHRHKKGRKEKKKTLLTNYYTEKPEVSLTSLMTKTRKVHATRCYQHNDDATKRCKCPLLDACNSLFHCRFPCSWKTIQE